jgi:type II restriction/modification system DNA methylase subunit YeeA
MWIIDFDEMPIEQAAFYEAPFEYVRVHVAPFRENNRDRQRREHWWRLGRSGGDLRRATVGLARYFCTTRVAKHRIFTWVAAPTLPDSRLVVFAREDDYWFGVLHSRVHEAWARGTGSQLRDVESGFAYTPNTCFETFPLPQPTEAQREAIAEAARELDRFRNGWLNPAGLSEAELRQLTLTNLYNARPTWLGQLHERLDAAVLAAYGWPVAIDREDLLARLLALNLARAAGEASGD